MFYRTSLGRTYYFVIIRDKEEGARSHKQKPLSPTPNYKPTKDTDCWLNNSNPETGVLFETPWLE